MKHILNNWTHKLNLTSKEENIHVYSNSLFISLFLTVVFELAAFARTDSENKQLSFKHLV